MTEIYALPNATEGYDIVGLLSYVNNTADGLFFPIMLLVIFSVITITSLSFSSISKSFTYGCFVSMVLGIPLSVLGLLAPKWIYFIIFCLAGGLVWVRLEND